MTDSPTRSTATTPDTSDGFHTFRELYQHRHSLFLLLLRMAPPVASPWWSAQHHPDADQPMFPGYVIAGMETPHGPISYHLPEDWSHALIAAGIPQLPAAPPWDGHTPDDVVDRLQQTAMESPRPEPRPPFKHTPEDQAKLDAMQAAMEQLAEAIGGPVPEGAKAMSVALGIGVPPLGEQLAKHGRTLPDADDWEARHQAWNLLRITDVLTDEEASAIGERLVHSAIEATGGQGVVFHGGTIRLTRDGEEGQADG